jgi:protein TonB
MKLVWAISALLFVNVEACYTQQVMDTLNLTPNVGVLALVDKAPEYPGGPTAMADFIRTNYRPVDDSHMAAKIYVEFIIYEDGTLHDVRIKRGFAEAWDKEALRVVRSMPRWKPADRSGTPFRTMMSLPIDVRQ